MEMEISNHTGKCPAHFKIVPLLMGAMSKSVGRDIFEDREFIEIFVPGGKSIISREATETDKHTYKVEYQAFKEGMEGIHSGTQINKLPTISPAITQTLLAAKVFTIEMLSEYPDGQLDDLCPNSRKLQTIAREYIRAKDSASYITELKTENKELESRVIELEKKLEALFSDTTKTKTKVKNESTKLFSKSS